ncbi:MAG: electron transfer flavoprotein subunit alpha/FixB family protein [Chloroflexi bacterium]|mgnify:CR=1 FL=1|nr:electron transfer flavoprotein subunit alpha/FixB family protein [Chloroflexota bacterium]
MTINEKAVFVFAEQVDNRITPVTFELIGKARELAAQLDSQVVALLPGYQVGSLVSELVAYGAEVVLLADHVELEHYRTEPYTQVLSQTIEKFQPEIVLIGATTIGRDLAPRVAGRVHTGLTADCTALEIEEETSRFLMTRPAFGGNLMATIVCPEHRPAMATVRPGVMIKRIPDDNAAAQIIPFEGTITENEMYTTIQEVLKKGVSKQDIQDARIIVAGGRGMRNAEGFAMLKDLADVLGGVVASSRAAVDAGLQDKSRQVGQTGKTVRPILYIACGISGAIQHLAGMEESDFIIAINSDTTAPIFNVADVGIVGDALKIVPKLTEAIRSERGL